MSRPDGTPKGRAFAATFFGLVGAVLMGGVAYTHGSEIGVGAVAGAILLGLLGHGVAGGRMSRITLYAVLFALFFGMIGPGVDDYGGHAVPPAALFGAGVGWLFRGRRVTEEASAID